MGFIKKKLFMISCILVMLLAGGIFFYGMGIDKANATQHRDIAGQVENASKLRAKVIPDNIRQQYVDNSLLAQKDAQAVEALARLTTMRPLIRDNIFPEPQGETSHSKFQKFADGYCDAIERLLHHETEGLRAGDRPTVREESQVEFDYRENAAASAAAGAGGSRAPIARRAAVPRRTAARGLGGGPQDAQLETLIEVFRQERAKSIAIYANTDSFFGYGYWKEVNIGNLDEVSRLKDSWFSQMGYWIESDVVEAVIEINGESKSVPTSPIKRLIEISFGGDKVSAPMSRTGSGNTFRRGQGAATAGKAATRRLSDSVDNLPGFVMKPKAIAATAAAPRTRPGGAGPAEEVLEGEITSSFTKRVGDDMVDVVQFEVAVVMDTSRIAKFLNALQGEKQTLVTLDGAEAAAHHRSQVTVLQIHEESVDSDAEGNAGYYYGAGSLATVRLICEYMFFRKGYSHLLPDPVKELLDPSAPAAPGPAGRAPIRG